MERALPSISTNQLSEHCRTLKQAILWCLFYREDEIELGREGNTLHAYFLTLRERLLALNVLLEYPPSLLSVIETVEAARLCYEKDCELNNHARGDDFLHYRKLVLDARALIDRIGGEVNAEL